MAKTDRKNSKKIFEGYRKHQKLWNGIFFVLFAVIGIGLAIGVAFAYSFATRPPGDEAAGDGSDTGDGPDAGGGSAPAGG